MKVSLQAAAEFSFLGKSSIAHLLFHIIIAYFEDDCVHIRSLKSSFKAEKKREVAWKVFNLLSNFKYRAAQKLHYI